MRNVLIAVSRNYEETHQSDSLVLLGLKTTNIMGRDLHLGPDSESVHVSTPFNTTLHT